MFHRAITFLLPAALLLAGPLASAAAPGIVDQAFGNTIVSTYPDGRKAELYLAQDGSYQAKGRKGDMSSGHWKVKAQKLCLSQSQPFPSPFAFCTPLPSAGLKSTWTAKALTGETIKVRLVQGHV